MQLPLLFFVEIEICVMKNGGEGKSLFWLCFQQKLLTAKHSLLLL